MSLKVLQSELNVSQTLLCGFKIITSDSCYSLVDEEAKVLLQNSWNSRRRIQKKLWNQHQQISSPWWPGWSWRLGTGLCCWTPSKNFPKTSMEAAHTHYGPGWL
jgi:hypothetical protein